MHLRGKLYSIQKEELKILRNFPAVYNQYTEILTLLQKYIPTFPLTYHVYFFEGKFQCKSSAAQISLLRRNKQNFLIFKTDFILSIPRKFVKKKYIRHKGSRILPISLHNNKNIDMC